MSAAKKNSILSPIIVLVCIGLVASFLLAGVYQITEPIISQMEEEAKNAALKEVLPDASGFTELKDAALIPGVAAVYKADNGAGYVCSTNCKSQQGGEISLMIGINASNAVNGISLISHNETAGIGDKVLKDSYFQNYYGISDADALAAVDTVSGATKTSSCVRESAVTALKQVLALGN